MVVIAQLVEHLTVAQSAVGSNPTSHPMRLSDLFEAPVAQLDRASDFGSDGWGFESLQARQSHQRC